MEESHFPFLWRWLGAAREPQRLSQAALWGFFENTRRDD